MSRIDKIAQGMLRPINPYSTIILGTFTLLWGLWIVNPLWSVFESAHLYRKAAEFAPEWAWGTWATVCGLVIILTLLKGNFKYLNHAMGFAIWHWCTVGLMLWWGDWHNTGGITYSFVAMYTIYCWLNIKINYVKPGIKSIF